MQASELTAVVSPGYAPFEQYHTQGNQGPWSDLYAFAGVLYWIATGNRPHEAAARVRQDTMPSALQAGDRAAYRPEFLAAIDWALSPNEGDRPQSVPEWRDALFGSASAPGKAIEPEKTQVAQPAAQHVFDPVLLKKLEADLAQYLGPIAPVVVRNAAKKAKLQSELIPLLAAEIADDKARGAFERRFAEVSRPSSQPASAGQAGTSGPTNVATALAATRFPVEVLERAERRLAEHIGAVARVVVKRAAMKARDEAELYLLLADEIEDKNDRKVFIRKAVSVSGKP
jgi:hypothetical protein